MAKRIDTMKIKLSLVILGVFVLLVIAIYPILGNRQSEGEAEVFEPAFAPAEYAYPEYFTDQELSRGWSWRLNENNVMTITKDGESYVVTADGEVWQETPDGLREVNETSLINDILKAAKEASDSSDVAHEYFTDNLEDRITYTDEEAREATGGRIDADTYNALKDTGLTDSEITRLLDSDDVRSLLDDGVTTPSAISSLLDDYTPEELINEIENGNYPEEIQNLIDQGYTVDEIIDMIRDEAAADQIDALLDDYTPEELIRTIRSGDYPEEIQELIDQGYTIDEIIDMIRSGSDADKLIDLIEDGYTADDIIALIEEGFTPDEITAIGTPSSLEEALATLEHNRDIDQQLADSLRGSGISVDDFKQILDEYGITPEEYLAGVETIQNAEDGTSRSTGTTTSAPAAKLTTSDVAAMTVDLGGNNNTVAEKEAQYQQNLSTTPVDTAGLASAIASATQTKTSTTYEQQNNQSGKTEFMAGFQNNAGVSQLTTNDIAAGTIITMTLKTGLNSDLPGMIVAEVSQNVFDSLSGRVLLIPKGTRLLASYDSSVSWGQRRALVAWTQLIRPDGLVLQLPGFSGVDAAGYTGYTDKVNNHTWELISSAFLASILDLAADEVTRQADNASQYMIGDATISFVETLESAGQEYLKKQMNLQPTLTVRPGRTIKLLVNQTMTLTPYKR